MNVRYNIQKDFISLIQSDKSGIFSLFIGINSWVWSNKYLEVATGQDTLCANCRIEILGDKQRRIEMDGWKRANGGEKEGGNSGG